MGFVAIDASCFADVGAQSDYSGHVHLKTLTLRGFKSFASATTLRFEPGINVVVGPNGSGKSNVVDALAWVMGEQGVKQLRGGNMADVIFAGTAKRPPLGRAEVSLTIDNSDGALPIDYSEVTISRTIFRSGGSEYAINGSACRLLDIQELLSDTGMGREMHVIIGQGRLDEVLTATPEDRRGFVEEAAGVLKHRRRKEKALRKIENMEGSLTRLEDLAAELRRQLRPLARQAEAARKAQVIQAEVRDARARLLADDLALQQARMEAGTVDEAKMREDIAENEQASREARERVGALEAAAAAANPDIARLADQFERLASLEERFRSLGQLAAERQRSLAAHPGLGAITEDPAHIRQRAAAAREEEESLRAEVQSAQDALRTAIEKRESAEEAQRTHERELAQLQRSAADRRENAARVAGRKATITQRIEALDAEAERTHAALAHARERVEETSRTCARLEEDIVASSQPDDTLAIAHEEASRERAQAEDALEAARTAERQAREAMASWNAKAETLALSLEPADATAWAIKDGHGVTGLLRDSVTVARGWESAVEAVLGGATSGVLAADLPSAVDLLRAVHEAEAGRLDITVEGEAHPRGRAEAMDAALAAVKPDADAALSALDAVKVRGGAAPAIRAALEGVCLAADLVTARQLVEAGAPMVATQAGDVLTPTRAWGGQATQASLLARSRAHEEALDQAESARRACEGAIAALAQAEEALGLARARYEETTAQLGERDSKVAAMSAELGALRQARDQAGADEERYRLRAEEITHESEAARAELAEVEAAEKASEAEPEGSAEQTEAARQAAEEAREAARQARDVETQARLELRTGEERVRSLAGRSESLERHAREVEERIERERVAAARREEAGKVAERVGAYATRGLNAASAVRQRVSKERAEAEARRSVQESELSAARTALEQLAERRRELDDVAHRRELALAEQRLRYEQLAERAMSELAVEAATLIEEYGPLVPIPAPTDDNPDHTVAYVREEQEERLAKAERQLARLGTINPLALEEHAATEERHAYVSGQLADLKASRDDLLGIVEEMDAKVEEVLTSALADVADRFEHVFATLFPGGQGKLVLTDPDSPLTTGIEIEARPPGKKVKRLSLLSGGERSLTAIAFLIAIFMARPSPFYVMDEVEAALDDVNLSRLLAIFKQLQANSQLLVVTHQKRTMEIADTIYGVAMKEHGVTNVVSQRLADIVPEQ